MGLTEILLAMQEGAWINITIRDYGLGVELDVVNSHNQKTTIKLTWNTLEESDIDLASIMLGDALRKFRQERKINANEIQQ